MADLRDRYRRDYRSVPIPTPPRKLEPRRIAADTQPVAPQPTPSPTPTPIPAKPLPTTPVAPVVEQPPAPQAHPEPRNAPSEPFQAKTQAETASPSKSQQKASRKALKKAEKQAKKQQRQAQKTGKKIKKWVITGVTLLILACLGIAGAYGYQHVKVLTLPVSYAKSSPFPILYPVKLPDGYYVDTNSFDYRDNAFVFTIRNNNDPNKTIAVSEQKVPDGFNPDKQLPDDDSQAEGQHGSFTTQAGKGQVGTFQGSQVATLASDKTWVIMNVSTIPSGDIAGVASSFGKVKPLPYLSSKRLYQL